MCTPSKDSIVVEEPAPPEAVEVRKERSEEDR
jgi:hypothetical protein